MLSKFSRYMQAEPPFMFKGEDIRWFTESNLLFLRIHVCFSVKMDCGVYKMDSTYVELSEVPQSLGVVRVNSAVKAFRFIMKQSYICALIAMMVSMTVLPFRSISDSRPFLRGPIWSLPRQICTHKVMCTMCTNVQNGGHLLVIFEMWCTKVWLDLTCLIHFKKLF